MEVWWAPRGERTSVSEGEDRPTEWQPPKPPGPPPPAWEPPPPPQPPRRRHRRAPPPRRHSRRIGAAAAGLRPVHAAAAAVPAGHVARASRWPAGGSRVGAALLDGLIIGAPGSRRSCSPIDPALGDPDLGLTATAHLLPAPDDARGRARTGRPSGKQIVGIRVVQESGEPFTYGPGRPARVRDQVPAVRHGRRLLPRIPTLLDYLWPLWDERTAPCTTCSPRPALSRPSVHNPDWDAEQDQGPFRWRRARVGRQAGARELGASVFELPPGASTFPLHAHYANEELLVVLAGRPTLRTIDGERELEEGDVVSFPTGRDGAHRVDNRTRRARCGC